MSTSTLDKHPAIGTAASPAAWPQLPNETEIYILPDGQVIIADLPAELMGLAAELSQVQPCQPPESGQP
jgi:hypothetical protein